MNGQKERKESGMIVVETTLSLVCFVIVLSSIVMLISIFTVHNKVQYAITQAANEIASYGYLYDAFNLRAADEQIYLDGKPYAGKVDETVTQVVDSIDQIGKLTDGVSNLAGSGSLEEIKTAIESLDSQSGVTYDSVKASAESIQSHLENPGDLLNGIIYIGVNKAGEYAKGVIAAAAGKFMTEQYLDMSSVSGDGRSADAYLRGYSIAGGMDGMDFSKSTVFCDADFRMVDLIVEYDIEFPILQFFNLSPKIHMVQRVSVPVWTGDGSGYEG